jgi:hypothetical protein
LYKHLNDLLNSAIQLGRSRDSPASTTLVNLIGFFATAIPQVSLSSVESLHNELRERIENISAVLTRIVQALFEDVTPFEKVFQL